MGVFSLFYTKFCKLCLFVDPIFAFTGTGWKKCTETAESATLAFPSLGLLALGKSGVSFLRTSSCFHKEPPVLKRLNKLFRHKIVPSYRESQGSKRYFSSIPVRSRFSGFSLGGKFP